MNDWMTLLGYIIIGTFSTWCIIWGVVVFIIVLKKGWGKVQGMFYDASV